MVILLQLLVLDKKYLTRRTNVNNDEQDTPKRTNVFVLNKEKSIIGIAYWDPYTNAIVK